MAEMTVLSALRRAATSSKALTLSGVGERGRWRTLFSHHPGDFQRDIEIRHEDVLAQATVFACMTLIASDIGKLRLKLVQQDDDGIWDEVANSPFSPVLRKPNRFQTRQKFMEQWIVSKLSSGNTYALKERDRRGVVIGLYILDPHCTRPLVAPNGEVYYQVSEDNMSGVTENMPAVPASEIIHDRMVCLYHPLVGVSPIFACGLAATKALRIQHNSTKFFQNMSRPSGMLTGPAAISDETAKRLKNEWELNYGGDNIGRVAVLGDGLKYEAMTVNAIDAQLVEQLKLSAEQVCSVFHVPAYMVGAAAIPPNNNVEALNLQYYSQCLQALIESCESCLDDGLGLTNVAGKTLGTEFELDDLLRMDSATLTSTLKEQVTAGITSPNEARKRINLPPVTGGHSPMIQQQNYSLTALAERDKDKPFAKPSEATPEAAAKAIEAIGEYELRKHLK